ncbi:hypothetical protein [Burkholderia ubonensis]|uniref:hypothetical protein n=1 Tax=Burkholderia ubonensis TaxID=101571 RepID=UPI000B32C761|nr:hypothetical protein [Burkholderia ubonensis]
MRRAPDFSLALYGAERHEVDRSIAFYSTSRCRATTPSEQSRKPSTPNSLNCYAATAPLSKQIFREHLNNEVMTCMHKIQNYISPFFVNSQLQSESAQNSREADVNVIRNAMSNTISNILPNLRLAVAIHYLHLKINLSACNENIDASEIAKFISRSEYDVCDSEALANALIRLCTRRNAAFDGLFRQEWALPNRLSEIWVDLSEQIIKNGNGKIGKNGALQEKIINIINGVAETGRTFDVVLEEIFENLCSSLADESAHSLGSRQFYHLDISLRNNSRFSRNSDSFDATFVEIDDDFARSNLPLEDYFDKIIDYPDFDDGLSRKSCPADFERLVAEKSPQAYHYISKHVNPYQIKGMARNIFSYFSTGALNKNCVICAKAVERNLDAMTSKTINNFWITQSTEPGNLPKNVSPENYTELKLTNDPLSQQLLGNVRENSKNIIMVPVKGERFLHAMNLVHSGDNVIVIDGQFGIVYDFGTSEGQHDFNRYYGVGSGINVLRIYWTGEAPATPTPSDWEILPMESEVPRQ